jgi:CHAT domain-containing protein
MERLLAVEREIRMVGEAFPATTLAGERFTLARFEATFDRRPYGIVHIASHGAFSSRSQESYVLTHDARMTIDRLAAILGHARDRAERPVELLTLSTCESAVGDERAALGLAGVAIQAGARSALATLWSVNDEATAELIGRFYRALARPGVSRGRALQRAQRALIASEAFHHPSQWAAFVLVNSWL